MRVISNNEPCIALGGSEMNRVPSNVLFLCTAVQGSSIIVTKCKEGHSREGQGRALYAKVGQGREGKTGQGKAGQGSYFSSSPFSGPGTLECVAQVSFNTSHQCAVFIVHKLPSWLGHKLHVFFYLGELDMNAGEVLMKLGHVWVSGPGGVNL